MGAGRSRIPQFLFKLMSASMHSRSTLAGLCATALVAFATACQQGAKPADAATVRADSIRRDSVARARQDSINRTLPGYVVDSILPIEEEVRRFKGKSAANRSTLCYTRAPRARRWFAGSSVTWPGATAPTSPPSP